MGRSPDVALRLPPHIQKQLATMACSPPPLTPSASPPSSQYHAALAIQYRQRIQGIIKEDISAFITADHGPEPEPTPRPSKRRDTPSSELEDQLPPYSAEDGDVDTAACTITIKELCSMDTPTSDDGDSRFFALVSTTTRESTRSRHCADVMTRLASRFSTCSSERDDADAIEPAAESPAEHDGLYDGPPAPLDFAPPKLVRAVALEAKTRPCSAPPSCPRSPSKVRRIVERFTSKKEEDTAAKDKRRAARQAVV